MKSLQNDLSVKMPSRQIVQILQKAPQFAGIKIGPSDNLREFRDVAHVIYFIKETREDILGEPSGNCACLIITNSGSLSLELSTSLCQFWNFWEWQAAADFSDLAKILEEILHFLRKSEPRDKSLYRFRSGQANERLHRAMRSEEKCSQLNAIFGYNLVASEA